MHRRCRRAALWPLCRLKLVSFACPWVNKDQALGLYLRLLSEFTLVQTSTISVSSEMISCPLSGRKIPVFCEAGQHGNTFRGRNDASWVTYGLNILVSSRIVPSFGQAICGDGLLVVGEECDDGNQVLIGRVDGGIDHCDHGMCFRDAKRSKHQADSSRFKQIQAAWSKFVANCPKIDVYQLQLCKVRAVHRVHTVHMLQQCCRWVVMAVVPPARSDKAALSVLLSLTQTEQSPGSCWRG